MSLQSKKGKIEIVNLEPVELVQLILQKDFEKIPLIERVDHLETPQIQANWKYFNHFPKIWFICEGLAEIEEIRGCFD